jgi:hypothetical protein
MVVARNDTFSCPLCVRWHEMTRNGGKALSYQKRVSAARFDTAGHDVCLWNDGHSIRIPKVDSFFMSVVM